MKILIIHQNFPGQFKNIAPALVLEGHDVICFTMQRNPPTQWQGVKVIGYNPSQGTTPNIHPWVSDFETKTIRGEAAFRTALKLKKDGYNPDIIIAHPGWGESLFLKDVWPNAKLGIYCEFFYHAHGADVGFDPEFPVADPGDVCRLRLKNLNNLLHFEVSDAGISPTYWQASTFPDQFRNKITVVHDGIDTDIVSPNPNVILTLNNTLSLTVKDEIITFVNRNLEPYRGYHIFMRALPKILRNRPNARVLIVGGNDVSYGAKSPNGQSWKDIFLNEVKDRIDLNRVHFLGNIAYNHFISLLQLSTVHVYLTYPFVLSWSLLEAMSASCAIVASNTKPLHEAIFDGDTGVLVDFFDVDGLADSVCELLYNFDKRAKLGANAREFAKSNYDLKKISLPRQLEWVNAL